MDRLRSYKLAAEFFYNLGMRLKEIQVQNW